MLLFAQHLPIRIGELDIHARRSLQSRIIFLLDPHLAHKVIRGKLLIVCEIGLAHAPDVTHDRREDRTVRIIPLKIALYLYGG